MGRGEGCGRDGGGMVKALKGKGLRMGVKMGLRVEERGKERTYRRKEDDERIGRRGEWGG